jgi:hypothetical protein
MRLEIIRDVNDKTLTIYSKISFNENSKNLMEGLSVYESLT